MWGITTFLAVFLALLLKIYITYRKFGDIHKIPGPPKHWFWGNLDIVEDGEPFLKSELARAKTYGPIYRMWLGPTMPFVSLNHPDSAKVLLTSSTNITKSWIYNFVVPWLGYGLLISTGAAWRSKRKLLTPAFHFKVLHVRRDYVPISVQQTKTFVEALVRSHLDRSVDIVPLLSRLTLDIIGIAAFDTHLRAQENDAFANEYIDAINVLSEEANYRFRRWYLLWDWIYFQTPHGRKFAKLRDMLQEFTRRVITARQKELQQGIPRTKEYNDFLSILLESKLDKGSAAFSFEDIRAEVDTFMFEGHDTTAHGLSWTLYVLAKYPQVQEAARKEIDQILGEREAPTYEHLAQLRYLTAVLKESHRLYPPVAFVSRQLTEPIDVGGYRLPAGTMVSVSPFVIHRSESVWKDPEAFLPERFLDPTKEPEAYSHIPFSAGPRNCIGQVFALNEERIIISTLLKRFKFALDTSHPIELEPQMILRPKYGIRLIISKRNSE